MTDLTNSDFDRADDLFERAHQEIAGLCSGERTWTMSIPVREDTDSDTLLSSALVLGAQAVAALRARVAEGTGGAQGEAEAWMRAVLEDDGDGGTRVVDELTTDREEAAEWAEGCIVVPLGRLRAPGAVAPAPDEDTAAVDEGAVERAAQVLDPHLSDGSISDPVFCREIARAALAAARRAPGADR